MSFEVPVESVGKVAGACCQCHVAGLAGGHIVESPIHVYMALEHMPLDFQEEYFTNELWGHTKSITANRVVNFPEINISGNFREKIAKALKL